MTGDLSIPVATEGFAAIDGLLPPVLAVNVMSYLCCRRALD